jgi:hypothetical protein
MRVEIGFGQKTIELTQTVLQVFDYLRQLEASHQLCFDSLCGYQCPNRKKHPSDRDDQTGPRRKIGVIVNESRHNCA